MASSLTPPARFIDPRGQRFGAGTSVVILAIAFATGWFWLAALVGLNLIVASMFGTRFFLPGRAWLIVRSALKLGPPKEPEHEYPPRFAQALGGIFIGVGTLLYVIGLTAGGWLLVGAVAALQTLLAVTGYCVGCKLYFLRWALPSLFAKLFRRDDELLGFVAPSIQRVA